MLHLALRNLWGRPLRSSLTIGGIAVAVAVLLSLSAFGEGYRRALGAELGRMGMQMMLVPLGCPYDAAVRVIKGKTLENSLPESTTAYALRDPAVSVAAPMLLASVPHPSEGRTDLWAGIDRAALKLKPWWRAKSGAAWFTGPDSVILGAEAAETELRGPGDQLYSAETGRKLRVAGVLERSGTSDDSLFFVPLRTAQSMFHQPGRLTAVAIRLRDPAELHDATERLQNAPGAQVVVLTEMMGTFLNLVGAVRTLLLALALVALSASAMTVFNTLLGSVLEQQRELAVMRAVGASRGQVFQTITTQTLALTLLGCGGGLLLAAVLGPLIEGGVRHWVPLAPAGNLLAFTPGIVLGCFGLELGVGALACLYPAWHASRVQPALAMRE
jgi:putative ABC transport system permease protein